MIGVRDKTVEINLNRFPFAAVHGGKEIAVTTIRVEASMEVLGERDAIRVAEKISAFFEDGGWDEQDWIAG